MALLRLALNIPSDRAFSSLNSVRLFGESQLIVPGTAQIPVGQSLKRTLVVAAAVQLRKIEPEFH